MDYRELLIKYIARVGSEEGVNFINLCQAPRINIPFTEEEIKELQKLDEESEKYMDRK